MKKINFLAVLQIILCLLCFLNNWFKDNILGSLSIFTSVILNIILFCFFLFTYIVSLLKFNSQKKFFQIFTLLLFITTIFLAFYDFRLIKTKIELDLYQEQRKFIINKIKAKEFEYYYEGNIKLPIYKYVSSDGEVYVYKNDDEGQVIGFWIYRGIMSGSIQLVYSSDEKIIDSNINYISRIEKLKPNWYYVITN